MNFVQKRTLVGETNGRTDYEDTEDSLLVADVVALRWREPVNRTGAWRCSLRPTWQNGARAWLVVREWEAGHGYTWEGFEESVLPFEDGVRLLIEHEVFAFPPPKETSNDD